MCPPMLKQRTLLATRALPKRKEMSGKDSYSTPSSYTFSLSTSLNDLWLSTTSRTDCRFTSIGDYLFDISIDNFVTVVENTAAKIFAFKSYRVMDNSIH